MRFRAEQHLRRQNEIREVRESGRRIDCREFTLWWKRREMAATTDDQRSNPSRVCVIASSKAVGFAVRRNRAKRRLREIFRRQQARVPAGCDLLLIARAAILTSPLPDLERRFAAACDQMSAPAPETS